MSTPGGAARDESHPVLLYDGPCVLCDASVRAVLALDRDARFRFAALGSRAAARLRGAVIGRGAAASSASGSGNATADIPGFTSTATTVTAFAPVDSVVLIADGRLWVRSSAVIRALWLLGFPWSWVGALLWCVPRPLRDALYRWVAANRAAWFGRLDACRLPAPGERDRFLDADER